MPTGLKMPLGTQLALTQNLPSHEARGPSWPFPGAEVSIAVVPAAEGCLGVLRALFIFSPVTFHFATIFLAPPPNSCPLQDVWHPRLA